MKASEIREITVEEIDARVHDFRKEVFNLRFQVVTGEIQNPKRMRALKKDIARALTIRTQKTKKGDK